VVGAVYDMVAGQPNQLLALTDTLFITSATSAEYTLPIASGYLSLNAGSYVVGVKESFSANVTLATNTEYYTPGMSWVFFNAVWDNNESYGFFSTYLMRANFAPVCFDPVTSFTESINGADASFTNTSTSASNATYLWDFGDGNTSTDENPTHTYAASGIYTPCLTVADSCGADSSCTTINISTVGLSENSFIDGLSIYPVPAQNSLTIANLTSGENFKMELVNSLGQTVKVIDSKGLEKVQIDLSSIANGYYHLKIFNSKVNGTRPLLVKH
jgi:PKD repeat protein